MTSAPRAQSVFDNSGELLLVKQALESRLPEFLHSCRWYGEKSGEIADVEWTPLGGSSLDGAALIVGAALIRLDTGSQVWYSLPVVVDKTDRGIQAIAKYESAGVIAVIWDAIDHPLFHQWLIQFLLDPNSSTNSKLGMTWMPTSGVHDFTGLSAVTVARVSRAEQSNSSIVLGDEVIVKLFRKLRSGINPDVEMGRFLTEHTQFEVTPATLGEFRIFLRGDEPTSFGVVQEFVHSVADGWEYALSKLSELNNLDLSIDQVHQSWLADARTLGETTAELHLELAEQSSNRDFAPEPIESGDANAWTKEVLSALNDVKRRFERVRGDDSNNASLVRAFTASAANLSERALGFERLVGCSKIRIHGDYHLGQTLRTTDGKWVILDFEGEPARTIEERRAKSSPLKDVAGMFRSFNYARGVSERTAGLLGTSPYAAWERDTRDAFLAGYLDLARPNQARYLPRTDEDVREALSAWELHKALYEILYELDNRPDWLWLPLAASLKLA
jgi:maltose alpha-D-glucosyltransferase/alpha-amylase